MNEIQIIYGTPPSKSNAYKIVSVFNKKMGKIHASLAKTTALIQYEKDFYIQCNKYRDKNISTYFELTIDVFYPNQRSDLDNSLKIVLDCLQAVKAVSNDNKCTKIFINKYLDKLQPRIEFVIKPAI